MRKFIVLLTFLLYTFVMISCTKQLSIFISFVENGGNDVEDITVTESNTNIDLPIPTRTGYTFDRWYVDESLTEPFVAVFLTQSSITLYAKWTINQYTITFETNDGTQVDAMTQDYHSNVLAPNEPEKVGYTFDGWYSNPNLTTAYAFTTMPAENMTLYAKWIINSYTLRFLDEDNTVLQTTTFEYNADLSEVIPPAATKEGYSFAGWDKTLPQTMPAAHVTLKATYTINSYTITFETNEGTQVDDITQNYQTDVIAPNDPEKIGHTFDGWYSDIDFKTPYTFETMPAENITLYAKWNINPYGITFYITDAHDLLNDIILYPGDIVLQVCSGESHYAVLTSNGRLFMWGENDYGQLGDDTNFWHPDPVEITPYFSLDEGDKIIHVSLGGKFSSALTSNGRLFMWGYNYYGQLGDNTTISRSTPTDITDRFNLVSGDKIIQVSLGILYYSAALTSNGRLFMWGFNEYGQLGEISWMDRITPFDITHYFYLESNDKIIQVSLGGLHSAALTSSGRLFMWGYNDYGQLGNDNLITTSLPRDITGRFNLVSGDRIVFVSLGLYHSSVLTSSGRLFTYGLNSYGQLGDNTDNDKKVPTEITHHFILDSGDRVIKVSMGWMHSSALTLNGRFFTWGRNESGQLGDNTTIHRYVPTEITNHFGLLDDQLIQISLGFNHTSTLTSSGKVFMWGWGALLPIERIIYTYEREVIHYNYHSEINYIPTREGYIFDGWYLDEKMTTPLDIDHMHAETLTLYGRWIIE